MLAVNQKFSGTLPGPGPQKMVVAIDGATRDEVDSPGTKDLAVKTASANGFGNAGFCENPEIAAINADTGEILSEADAFTPGTPVSGFRVQFTFAKRI